MTEAKILTLVNAMNDLADNIDPAYGKIAVFPPKDKKEGDCCVESVRYFIQSRPVADENGVERWKFVARVGK